MSLGERIRSLAGFFRRTERSRPRQSRAPVSHVILLDGTMSMLDAGCETNVGLIYKLLNGETGPDRTALYYEAGVQWTDWSTTLNVIEGRGINRQIRRAYGWLASHYYPGDRIFLIGYSRGAYAARSLAGMIDHVGLLKRNHATVRLIRDAYRHYQLETDDENARIFRKDHCHPEIHIDAVAVFDTVKALGLSAPFVRRWQDVRHAFHNHALGPTIRHGFHALALDETREAFRPVLWECEPDHKGHVEQVWFRGGHGDVGGQLNGRTDARPLSNIPLVWMLDRLNFAGLELPDGWRTTFPTDADAPAVGAWHGWAKFFLVRRRRKVGNDPSEALHVSVAGRAEKLDLPLADQTIA